MPIACVLRLQIEHLLEGKIPSALTPVSRTVCEVASTGIDEVDGLLGGGLPVGTIGEITGPASSGRTTLALSFLARCTAENRVCAWVDAGDALDPESAAASGVTLGRLLWVRCHDTASRTQKEDKQQLRLEKKPWTKLDQALRVTDLLLQSAGFAAIVLDLGDTAQEHGNRIPLATWFRFRQAADRTRCCLVVLGQAAYAQSASTLVLECSPQQAETAGETVMRGFIYAVQRRRQRFASSPITRRPPASTWSVGTAWEAEKYE